jgi:biopolymer transport protein ExbD
MVNVGSCAGRIDGIEVGVPSLAPMKQVSFNELNGELARFFQAPGTPFEQVVVRVSPELHYGELMRVVDVCASQRLANHELLKKLSFEELGSRR